MIDGCDTASGYSLSVYEAASASAPELHVVGAYESSSPDGTIRVENDNPGEIILVLNSYEPANWQVENTGGGTISHIAVTGYNHSISTVSGSGASGATVTSDYWSACSYGWPFTTGGCDEPTLVATAETHYGASLASFRGCYRSSLFLID